MSSNRTKSILAAGLLVLLAGWSAVAQDLSDVALFGPPDISSYGTGIRPKEGHFVSFDGLNWWISTPNVAPIGFPNLTRTVNHTPSIQEIQSNTLHTGFLQNTLTEGLRVELGRIEGRRGWFLSTYFLNPQSQTFQASDVDVVFQDIAFGAEGRRHLQGYVAENAGDDGDVDDYALPFLLADLPITFDEVVVKNSVDTWGVEMMYLARTRRLHRGGFLEFFAGVRYLEFDDTFQVDARGTDRLDEAGDPVPGVATSRFIFDLDDSPIGPGTVLADSNWVTQADNHIVGAQIGARWFRQRGRWSLSAEGRFLAGLNMQRLRNQGVLGSELAAVSPYDFGVDPEDPGAAPGYPYMPLLREPYQFNNTQQREEFSPAAELRVEFKYQITSAVSARVGWTGFWLDGLARASNSIDYTISSSNGVMLIDTSNNRQDAFIHGLNFGVVVNR